MSHWFVLLFREQKHMENHKYSMGTNMTYVPLMFNQVACDQYLTYFIGTLKNNCAQNVCHMPYALEKIVMAE